MAAVETDADRAAIAAMNDTNDADDGDERSLEDRANDELEAEEDGQFLIAGTKASLNASAGGRRPDASRSKVRAITLPMKGQFDKGERRRITMDVRVKNVAFEDEEDQHGKVIRTWRTHTFTPEAIVEIGPASAE